MKDKTVILVRHGEFNCNTGALKPIGKEQMALLATRLHDRIDGRRVLVFSSDQVRTMEGAEIISGILADGSFHQDEVFFSYTRAFPPRCQEIIEFITERADEADVFVIVTHYEVVEWLPAAIADHVLGVRLSFNWSEVEMGDGIIIDCATQTCEYISHRG